MWKPRRIVESSGKEDVEGVGEHQHASSEDEEIEHCSYGPHPIFRKSDDDKKSGRANKNRPMEVSSKKLVARYREVVQTSKKKKSTNFKGQKYAEELNNQPFQSERQSKSDAKSSNTSVFANHIRKEREASKKGIKPFYLKKSDIRKEKLISKYEA